MFIIAIPFLIIASFIFSIKFYCGIARKMDLIAEDIKKYGAPTQKVIYFDSGRRNTELDTTSNSSLDYLFYKLPDKNKHPELYKDPHFFAEYIALRAYRRYYTIAGIILLFFIIIFAVCAIIPDTDPAPGAH